jgi:2,4-didehydro-3-deoxy-L-rhamnonate hydrolase
VRGYRVKLCRSRGGGEPAYSGRAACVLESKSSLCGPNDTVILPEHSTKGDWEVELGIVIGRRASYVEQDRALDPVAGCCIVNDVSEREYQLERGRQRLRYVWPCRPLAGDPRRSGRSAKSRLEMWLDVNGKRMQTGNTRTMIFSCAALISYISRVMILWPGDIITTGTPPGVGLGKKPKPIFLKPGDVMTLGIEKLGKQRQQVVAWRAMEA